MLNPAQAVCAACIWNRGLAVTVRPEIDVSELRSHVADVATFLLTLKLDLVSKPFLDHANKWLDFQLRDSKVTESRRAVNSKAAFRHQETFDDFHRR